MKGDAPQFTDDSKPMIESIQAKVYKEPKDQDY